jgi:hypothetical protein
MPNLYPSGGSSPHVFHCKTRCFPHPPHRGFSFFETIVFELIIKLRRGYFKLLFQGITGQRDCLKNLYLSLPGPR